MLNDFRGEIMRRKDNIFKWKDVLDLSDYDFCIKLGIGIEVSFFSFSFVLFDIGFEKN